MTSIHYINATNDISMNDGDKLSINIMHHFYHQRIMNMYLLDQNMIQRNGELDTIKKGMLDLLLNKSNRFEWHVSLLFFVLNDKKLPSHMAHISEHSNSSNHKIHSHDQTSNMIFNLGHKKREHDNKYTCQINHLQNSLLMSIVDTLKIIYPILRGNQT